MTKLNTDKNQLIEVPYPNIFENDKLNREPLIKDLSQIISSNKESLVFALNGSWGTGKTIFVRMWSKYLEKEHGVKSIYFSAWENDFSKDPLIAILGELNDHFKKNKKLISILNKIKKTGKKTTKENLLNSIEAAINDHFEKDKNLISSLNKIIKIGANINETNIRKNIKDAINDHPKKDKNLISSLEEIKKIGKKITKEDLLSRVKNAIYLLGVNFLEVSILGGGILGGILGDLFLGDLLRGLLGGLLIGLLGGLLVVFLKEKKLPKNIQEYSEQKKLLDHFKSAIKELLEKIYEDKDEKNKPLVIFIDELDRCRPLYAIELLERIKHLFGIERIIFILSIDKKQLSESIKSQYGNIDTDNYLRRFIDLEHKLAHGSIEDFCAYLYQRFEFEKILEKKGMSKIKKYPSIGLFFLQQLFPEEMKKILGDRYIDLSFLQELAKIFALSLRQLEQVFLRLKIIFQTIEPEVHGFTFFISAFLEMLKSYNPDLYYELIQGKQEAKDKATKLFQDQPGKLSIDKGELSIDNKDKIEVQKVYEGLDNDQKTLSSNFIQSLGNITELSLKDFLKNLQDNFQEKFKEKKYELELKRFQENIKNLDLINTSPKIAITTIAAIIMEDRSNNREKITSVICMAIIAKFGVSTTEYNEHLRRSILELKVTQHKGELFHDYLIANIFEKNLSLFYDTIETAIRKIEFADKFVLD